VVLLPVGILPPPRRKLIVPFKARSKRLRFDRSPSLAHRFDARAMPLIGIGASARRTTSRASLRIVIDAQSFRAVHQRASI